jgi:diguanylate cyclase (GGDEF)-like protein
MARKRIELLPQAHRAADTLTGLFSREAMEARMRELLGSGDLGAPVSVAVFDVDLLGQTNRERGSAAGDAMIALLAGAVSGHFSRSGVTCYRFGGDAVGVLFEETEKERAFMAVEEFRREFSKVHTLNLAGASAKCRVGVSAGVAAFPDDGATVDVVCIKATEALYRAKVTGRDKTCLAREEKMVTKTSHYTQGQLMGLRRLAEREGIGEAVLLREALNDLLRKYNS